MKVMFSYYRTDEHCSSITKLSTCNSVFIWAVVEHPELCVHQWNRLLVAVLTEYIFWLCQGWGGSLSMCKAENYLVSCQGIVGSSHYDSC